MKIQMNNKKLKLYFLWADNTLIRNPQPIIFDLILC